MGVMEMRKISLVAQERDRHELMESLQAASLVHILAMPNQEVNVMQEQAIDDAAKNLLNIERIIENLNKFMPSSLAIPPKYNSLVESLPILLKLLDDIECASRNICELEEHIKIFSPFGDFDEDLGQLDKHGIFLKLAILTDKQLLSWPIDFPKINIIKKISSLNYVAIFTDSCENLSGFTFDPPKISLKLQRQNLAELINKHQDLSQEFSRWSYQLRSFAKLADEARNYYDRLVELKKSHLEDGLFGITGFVLKNSMEPLKKSLLKYVVALRIEEPKKDSDVPVKLNNNRVVKGFETIIRAFTGVNYFEKDKTPIVALLFVFFGSLCFLDAGYGFLLILSGYLVNKKINKNLGQVFMCTGVFASVIGLLCGQFFGLVFAKDILLDIPPVFSLATDPMLCFKFSLLVGFFALALANVVNIYEKGLANNALGNFLGIIGGLLWVADKSSILSTYLSFMPTLLANLATAFLCLTALAWVIFPDQVFGEKARVANVLWTLYSAPVGLVQDILSHMRLFGIALSGAILALVVNKIAGMMPIFGGAVFAFVGHIMVFLLSLLSLYIHTNRLIFLEFGSKCMSGGNNYFTPFSRRFSNEKNN